MPSAATVPVLDPVPGWHNRREAQLLQMNPPLREERDTRIGSHDDNRICTHWPDGGVEHIRAAARLLRVVAEGLSHDGLIETPAVRYTGCIDLESLLSEPDGDPSMQRLAALLAQVQAQSGSLRSLADDFATVSGWLATAAESNWKAAKAMRRMPGLAAALGESQRLISKDSFSADVNALIAALLRRAVKLLDLLPLETGSGDIDTAQQRFGVRVLVPTAALLDNAAHLAANATRFVEEFDRRWRQMRHQAALAVASTARSTDSTEPRP